MEDKFQEYYSMVDIYEEKQSKSFLHNEEKESSKAQFFKLFPPISIPVLINNLEIIINKLCQELGSKNLLKKR